MTNFLNSCILFFTIVAACTVHVHGYNLPYSSYYPVQQDYSTGGVFDVFGQLGGLFRK